MNLTTDNRRFRTGNRRYLLHPEDFFARILAFVTLAILKVASLTLDGKIESVSKS